MVIQLINNYSLYCYKYGRARVTLFAIDKRSETHILRRDMKRIFKFVQKKIMIDLECFMSVLYQNLIEKEQNCLKEAYHD